MKFLDYLKDKIFSLVMIGILGILVFVILYSLNCTIYVILYLEFLIYLILFACFLWDYFKRKKFYNHTLNLLDKLDNKNLVQEMLPSATFIDSKILKEILYETDKYKIEEINKYKTKSQALKEFIEMWVHEIKTPLSSAFLTIYNNPSKLSDDLKISLDKIEDYVEQVLFYSRSEAVSKDYIVKKYNLSSAVNKVILKHKQDFLLKKISLELNNLEIYVNTDIKWLEFIIDQIINNSIKYTDKNAKIKIYTTKDKEKVCLFIEDNGIGINPSDLPRVFDKGFTGKNGRTKYNSTGIGLYLVKKLCDKLKHGVEIESNKGTIVKLTFPIGSYTDEITTLQ